MTMKTKSLMTKETCMSIVVFEEVVQYTSSLKIIVRSWKPNIIFLFKSLIIQILMKDCDNFVEAQKQLMMLMMELEKQNDLNFFDVMNVWMRSLQDVDGFEPLAKHEKQNPLY